MTARRALGISILLFATSWAHGQGAVNAGAAPGNCESSTMRAVAAYDAVAEALKRKDRARAGIEAGVFWQIEAKTRQQCPDVNALAGQLTQAGFARPAPAETKVVIEKCKPTELGCLLIAPGISKGLGHIVIGP